MSTFALRLPSALLSTGAAWLTYLIGKELFDRRTALVAATLQAVSPFLMMLVQGYQFSDHIDVALLFWVEVGVYFLARALRTGSWRDVLLCGVAQGLAFLCKSYLAAIVFGIALTAWLLPVCRLARREQCRLGFVQLLGLLGVTLLVALPWQIYCAEQYPEEFWHEHAQIWKHLHSNVEQWAAPWDRVVFDYLIAMYGVFYTPILVAGMVLLGKAVAQRHRGLWLVYAWGLGVLLPHVFAVTKTPSATVLAMPPLLLLLGHLVAEASRGERWPLTALTGILVMSIIFPAVVKNPGHGHANPHVFGSIMNQALWVIDHVEGTLALVAGVGILGMLAGNLGTLGRYVRGTALVFCAGVLAWLGLQTVQAAWRVTSNHVEDPFCVEVGAFARAQLPENAVLFCEEPHGFEHLTIMFYADRTCYPLAWGPGGNALARQVLQAGGVPYLVSHRRLPLAPVHVSRLGGPTIYRWQPPG